MPQILYAQTLGEFALEIVEDAFRTRLVGLAHGGKD
jgi:hypothetical protein